jgi:hypothetical protein
LRKLTVSILGMICALLFFIHALYAAGLMLGILSFSVTLLILGRILVSLILVHAVLALPVMLSNTLRGGKKYISKNITYVIQEVMGIVLLIFVFYHTPYFNQEPSPLELSLIVITLAAVGIHIYIGLPKSFITLGWISDDSNMKAANILSFFLTIVPAAISIIAIIIYYPTFYTGG